ncbi:MAG: hypothetical protein V3U54_05515 [Thermodesulfobacteriota bacterium]
MIKKNLLRILSLLGLYNEKPETVIEEEDVPPPDPEPRKEFKAPDSNNKKDSDSK